MNALSTDEARAAIAGGQASLGIELGSTRIKACLIAETGQVLAVGSHEWENSYVDRVWTYSLDEVWSGIQAAYAALGIRVQQDYGMAIESLASIGISAMMHGYLAFDAQDQLLVPFRTWRNTSTGAAASELSDLFGVNIPLRWSIAHYRQAMLDAEPHVGAIDRLTTLAGYVHTALTGSRVLGVGDASGMFPIDPATGGYDAELVVRFDELAADAAPRPLLEVLPTVLSAGADAGQLSDEGAALLDPTGALRPGALFCPPEGDAGTGMVATNAVAPRTGNVSAGTSIFAMIVLERALATAHDELDIVTTPAGDPVAMVHCNNGASELAAWVSVFQRFSDLIGSSLPPDSVYEALFTEALTAAPDAGGILSYNHLSGEPIAGLDEGRPMVIRTPDSQLTLANFLRSQLSGVFATLSLGMRVLDDEGVEVDRMLAHGGIFRTAGVAQRVLAAALDTAVSVERHASEGGAWGIAVLAAYAAARHTGATDASLAAYLDAVAFADAEFATVVPDPADVAGYASYLDSYRAGLAAERAAVTAL